MAEACQTSAASKSNPGGTCPAGPPQHALAVAHARDGLVIEGGVVEQAGLRVQRRAGVALHEGRAGPRQLSNGWQLWGLAQQRSSSAVGKWCKAHSVHRSAALQNTAGAGRWRQSGSTIAPLPRSLPTCIITPARCARVGAPPATCAGDTGMDGCGDMKGCTAMDAASTMAGLSAIRWEESRAEAAGCAWPEWPELVPVCGSRAGGQSLTAAPRQLQPDDPRPAGCLGSRQQANSTEAPSLTITYKLLHCPAQPLTRVV